MKKHVVACVVVVSIILLVLICGPILINESYKANEGYITEWGAADVLAYFASALSFVGTTFVSIIALYLTHKYEKDSKKREDRLLAIDKYVLFDFGETTATFTKTIDTDIATADNQLINAELISGGFNGNQAILKNDMFSKLDSLTLIMAIKNISDNTAVNLYVANEAGEKVEWSNIIHSRGTTNEKKHIISGDDGVIRLTFSMEDLKQKNKLKYYLTFSNQFGQMYRQEIVVSYTCGGNIIQVDRQCSLDIKEF